MNAAMEALLRRFPTAKKNGAGWKAPCPCHEDRSPSLNISEGADGRVLLKCHAGCSTESICAAVGISMSDLFSQSEKPQRRIVATYDYQDSNGNLLFQVVRHEPKDFRQRRPDPKSPGNYIWNTQG